MSATIHTALAAATARLKSGGVDQARMEAGSLLAHVLGHDRAYLLAHPEKELSASEFAAFESAVIRRSQGQPLQYITGHQEFFKLDFKVTPEVLIPRPETELLAEAGIEVLRNRPGCIFADVGTGSGCIAISLLAEAADTRAVATDSSPAALDVARENARRHDVIDRLKLIHCDLLAEVKPGKQFDLIVSNPPYIRDQDLPSLQREVQHEPARALSGGPDGLSVIRRLVETAADHLTPQGYLMFEFGYGQDGPVKELIDERIWRRAEIRCDLQGIPRVIVLQIR